MVKRWCRTLSWIAQRVCHAMLVPEGALISKDPEESLDLLRVFRYYPTATTTTKSEAREVIQVASPERTQLLGSSEHTDWGSLTIVWQDDVGGLQTYCQVCNKWIDVDANVAATDDYVNSEEGNNDINTNINHQ